MAGQKRENGEEGEFSWAELPSEVQSNILGWLPLRALFRSKRVCKLWNSMISSPSFTHFPSRCSANHPWLIFFTPESFPLLLAFDFDGHSWFRFDVGFPSSMLDALHVRNSSLPSSAERGSIWCSGTASGLLLLDFRCTLHVCNPLTKSLVKLPPFKSIEEIVTQGFSTSHVKGIFPSSDSISSHAPDNTSGTPSTYSVINYAVQEMPVHNGHDEDNVKRWHMGASEKKGKVEVASQDRRPCFCSHDYTAVVIGRAKRELVIEAYSLNRNSWDIVGTLPTSFIIRNDQMLECNGSFYSLLSKQMGMLVVGESNDEGTACWRVERAMPVVGVCCLLVCQNFIFIVCPFDIQNNGFVIWRYQSNSRAWIRLRDMPEDILEEVKSLCGSNWVRCVGVGNHICFRALGTLRVLTYNLCNELWSWLPEPSIAYDTVYARNFQFEPRLDYTRI